jgi:CubicO group peptidase (beta-lactamase class C family)
MKSGKLIFVLVIAAVYLCGESEISAQTVTEKLDALFNPSPATSASFNGNVLAAENGRIIYQKSFGYADFSTRKPNAKDSKFQTASVSKVFTATAVLQLRDRGKLKLTDAVVKYLPDFPFPNIAVRHLLSHTSGLPNLELYESVVRANPELIIGNRDIIPALKAWKKPVKFQPGEKWDYCNTNYGLLVLIVEKVGNLSFTDYLKKFIFEPAKMNDTYLRVAASSTADKNLVKNHILPVMYQTAPQDIETVKLKDGVKMWRLRYENYNTGFTAGDQNVLSTTEDLLKFDQALNAGKLLKSRTLEEAFSPTRLNNGEGFFDDFGVPFGKKCSYGLGWIVCDDPKTGKVVGHDGFNRGIASIFYRNIAKKQTIVMFDNTEGRGFNQRAASIVNVLNGENALPLNLKNSIAREFGATLLRDGIETAILRFNEMKKDEARFYLDEKELNLLGYEFLFNGYKAESLEAFRLNVLSFPDSFNVYDSYAESLAANGKKQAAILMYQKAISLNPNSEGSRKALKSLVEQ